MIEDHQQRNHCPPALCRGSKRTRRRNFVAQSITTSNYLKVIPQEVIERDYGCGDPSRYLHEGETVLDLGSGAGKICFIAAQIVGPKGKVIGMDMTDEMLEVARRNAPIVAERIRLRECGVSQRPDPGSRARSGVAGWRN